MEHKPPIPICKAFLSCRQTITDPKFNDISLIGLCRVFQHHRFPAAVMMGIFARLSSAHGEYQLEIHLQTMEGEVVWKEGPPSSWSLKDPLMNYDLRFNISLVFPQPGTYDLVLLVNGTELAREQFFARLTQEPAAR